MKELTLDQAEKCQMVDGWTGVNSKGEPSIVEVLGPQHSVHGNDIFINEATHEEAELRDAEALKEQVEASQHGRIW
jgi:hypothetical protein